MTLANLQRDDFDGLGKLTRDQGTGVDLEALLSELAERHAFWNKAEDDAAAGTATAEHVIHRAKTYSQTIASIAYIPDAALTADNTNYATITVRIRTAAGADGGVVASVTTEITGSGDWTAFVPVELDLASPSNVDLDAGESLTVQIAKAASGVIVPAGQLDVVFS